MPLQPPLLQWAAWRASASRIRIAAGRQKHTPAPPRGSLLTAKTVSRDTIARERPQAGSRGRGGFRSSQAAQCPWPKTEESTTSKRSSPDDGEDGQSAP